MSVPLEDRQSLINNTSAIWIMQKINFVKLFFSVLPVTLMPDKNEFSEAVGSTRQLYKTSKLNTITKSLEITKINKCINRRRDKFARIETQHASKIFYFYLCSSSFSLLLPPVRPATA